MACPFGHAYTVPPTLPVEELEQPVDLLLERRCGIGGHDSPFDELVLRYLSTSSHCKQRAAPRDRDPGGLGPPVIRPHTGYMRSSRSLRAPVRGNPSAAPHAPARCQ